MSEENALHPELLLIYDKLRAMDFATSLRNASLEA